VLQKPIAVVRFIARSSRRIAVSVVGAVLLLAGLAMLVLPGPGLIVIVLGFAVLGTEYVWAAAALERSKRIATKAGQVARDGAGRVARGASGTVRAGGRRLRR
jgi:uncharacterized membrane protein YdbT with pleckstrin-like domain